MRILMIILLLSPLVTAAQLQMGWRTDTYAGINATLLNPALAGRTPYRWDVNLGEAAFFAANNYAYLNNTSAAELFRDRNAEATFVFQRDVPADAEKQAGLFVYDFATHDNYFAHTLASVLGPSLSVQVAPATRVGLFTRWQTRMDATQLDADFGFYRWEQLPEDQPFTVDPAHLAVANWSEVGLTVAQGITIGSGELTVGTTVRRLWGHRGGYLSSSTAFEATKLPGSIGVTGLNFDLEGAFTNNIANEDNLATTPGHGWAADLGVLYRIDLGDDYYRWELGVALLDVGSLKFSDGERHQFNSNRLAIALNQNYETLQLDNGLDAAVQQLSEDVFGDASISRVGTDFRMYLPTTLALQATYRLAEWAKVEGHFLVGVRTPTGAMQRASVLAVTPRVERHWWGVGLPVSLYAGQQLRVGLAVRLGPLFVGTDQLGGSLFRAREMSGADVYMGVKLHPWNLGGNGSSRGKAKGKRRGGKEVECYKF